MRPSILRPAHLTKCHPRTERGRVFVLYHYISRDLSVTSRGTMSLSYLARVAVGNTERIAMLIICKRSHSGIGWYVQSSEYKQAREQSEMSTVINVRRSPQEMKLIAQRSQLESWEARLLRTSSKSLGRTLES